MSDLIKTLLDIHAPFNIYDECDCEDNNDADHFEIRNVGYTCDKALRYVVCRSCCMDAEYQSDWCHDTHDHDLNPDERCPTVQVILEWTKP